MHELSVTESLLEIAIRHAEQAGAGRITGLYLVIGQLSSVVDDSVQFYWDIISQGTAAEGARLHFHRIPAVMECQTCSHRYHPTPDELACPECGSAAVKLISGDEFRLDAIDVESLESSETGQVKS